MFCQGCTREELIEEIGLDIKKSVPVMA
jgi:hypothetical protein